SSGARRIRTADLLGAIRLSRVGTFRFCSECFVCRILFGKNRCLFALVREGSRGFRVRIVSLPARCCQRGNRIGSLSEKSAAATLARPLERNRVLDRCTIISGGAVAPTFSMGI